MNGWGKGMRRLAVRVAIATLVLPSYAAAKCEIGRYGELPVTMSRARPLITGSINGQPAMFMADSGAFFSMLSRDSAQRYALKLSPPPMNMSVRGIGGEERIQQTRVAELILQGFAGSRALKGVDFFVGGNGWAEGIAGVIGQNVIGYADTEYDLPHGVIRLFRAKDCRNAMLAYWATADSVVAEMTIAPRTPLEPHLVGGAKLNGDRIKVVFDSGSWRSMLSLKAAARAGIKPESDGVANAGLAQGIGARRKESWIARFDTLDLGGELIRNARLHIADVDLPSQADMLLGADFFLAHRIYVSAAQNKLYFTYNGGPVFNLKDHLEDEDGRVMASTTPAVGVNVAAPGESLSGAAEYRRRGAAFASRNAFQAAIADLDEAIRIDASDAENYYQRGLIYEQSHDAEKALADFDETLKLNGDHIDALTSRGALRLAANDEAAARADFEAAEKIAPRDVSLSLNIARIYQAAGHFDEAIVRLNAWIAANPRDERVSDALRNRCLMRGLANKELDMALSDCNNALKKQSANSVVLVNRALVYFRLGNFDKSIADFKAAMKLQPKNAWALYGLGLAELKKGLKMESDKDLQSAVVIDSSVVQSYERIGLKP